MKRQKWKIRKCSSFTARLARRRPLLVTTMPAAAQVAPASLASPRRSQHRPPRCPPMPPSVASTPCRARPYGSAERQPFHRRPPLLQRLRTADAEALTRPGAGRAHRRRAGDADHRSAWRRPLAVAGLDRAGQRPAGADPRRQNISTAPPARRSSFPTAPCSSPPTPPTAPPTSPPRSASRASTKIATATPADAAANNGHVDPRLAANLKRARVLPASGRYLFADRRTAELYASKMASEETR